MKVPDIGKNKTVSLAMGAGALIVFGIALIGWATDKLGITDPHVSVKAQASLEESVNRKNLQYKIVEAAMTGEVAKTANRTQEAIGVALAASLFVSNELSKKRLPANAESLVSVLLSKGLLPGMVAGPQPGTLISDSGSIAVRFQRLPIGIEVVSIGKDRNPGQGILIRIPTNKNVSESGIWLTKSTDQIVLPRPFAIDAELIAIGWQPDVLPTLPQ